MQAMESLVEDLFDRPLITDCTLTKASEDVWSIRIETNIQQSWPSGMTLCHVLDVVLLPTDAQKLWDHLPFTLLVSSSLSSCLRVVNYDTGNPSSTETDSPS